MRPKEDHYRRKNKVRYVSGDDSLFDLALIRQPVTKIVPKNLQLDWTHVQSEWFKLHAALIKMNICNFTLLFS